MQGIFSSGLLSILSSESILPVLWYVVLAVAVFAYSLGEGFDLGISSIYFFSRTDEDRRKLLNSIGPFWDGNEVWLIIIIAGMFAGFPKAYSMMLSIFYMPVWVFVTMLIIRGVSLEFRSKSQSKKWKSFWDVSFSSSGTLIAFFLGTLLGNLLMGLPLDQTFSCAEYSWTLFFRPYAVLCGLLVVAAYAIHGSCFALIKIDGRLEGCIVKRFSKLVSIFLVLLITIVITTTLHHSVILSGSGYPIMIASLLISTLSLTTAVKNVRKSRYYHAFWLSTCNLISLVVAGSVMLFPALLRSTISSQYTIDIYNSAVDSKTLKVLLLIVVIGLPLVIAYAVYVYRVFRGKTNFDSIY